MALTWHLCEGTLGDTSPWTVELVHKGVRALAVSVRDPDRHDVWRAAEHGEKPSQGSGFHAEYEEGVKGDRVTVWFDARLRAEPVRIAYAVG
jgi:hypothetical protein